MHSLKIFLPHATMQQIEPLFELEKVKETVTIKGLTQDWQSLFCQSVNYPDSHLPWSQLRMAQFGLSPNVKTIACCDPVMLQLTHRGAYMMGQSPLTWTHNDAIRVVAQINEKLMNEGESLYLIDKNAWLFCSEQAMSFSAPRVDELIGKDMFDFSYGGQEHTFWQKLTTEMQMLMKQMQDYQGLTAVAPETCLGVHFFDCLTLNESKENHADERQQIPFIKNTKMTLVSNNDLIKTFCMNTLLTYCEYEQLDQVETDECILILFETEQETYPKLVQFWQDRILTNKKLDTQIVLQDRIITRKNEPSLLQRIFS